MKPKLNLPISCVSETERTHCTFLASDLQHMRLVRPRQGTISGVTSILLNKFITELQKHGITDITREDDLVRATNDCTITLRVGPAVAFDGQKTLRSDDGGGVKDVHQGAEGTAEQHPSDEDRNKRRVDDRGSRRKPANTKNKKGN